MISLKRTDKLGTPKRTPIKPNSPPPTITAKSTQNPDIPIESPIIFGTRILPSICWRTKIIRTKPQAGPNPPVIKIIKVPGTAPINGPT